MDLAEVFVKVLGDDIDIEFVAFDGSKTGRIGSDTRLEVKSPRAVSAIVAAPGQLGVARAYVNGDLDFTGDVYTAFERLAAAAAEHRLSWSDKARLAKQFAPAALRRRPPPPPEEVRLSGRRHGKRRDAAAISHHYDVSNTFYRWLLGPTMAYTCAVFPTADATLDEAQDEKFDLVCRKLDLQPGMRLLDVGCGWGGMVRHASANYGVKAIGVTLSRQQAEWGARMLQDEGLSGLAEVRHGDYRDVPESSFDVVSSIGLTEHIGKPNYPSYFQSLRSKLVDGGRLLNHSITRSDTGAATLKRRGFINRYIFPDGELVHAGHLVDQMERASLEVQHEENFRVHYAMTLAKWSENLDEHWDEAVAEIGLRKARVWRLYLAGSRWGFVHNVIQLHQVLATRTSEGGVSGMPLRPKW
ncbi:MAG: class I SAM-dependent methyltransferase [Candidatus Nanopelagicales bacterium]|nr:class I SAM-dependent methyltransferase [Candidatus Nanopelagicales bacterium]MDZ4248892.1 class I SAM-dependent methyltransferase [Candidatus Nanopelagicales bacterium]